MTKQDAAIYVAKEGFTVGGTTMVPAGATVEAGHPIMKGRDHLFAPFVPTFALGEPKAAESPLSVRNALVARAKALRIPAKGKNDELAAAIAAAEKASA